MKRKSDSFGSQQKRARSAPKSAFGRYTRKVSIPAVLRSRGLGVEVKSMDTPTQTAALSTTAVFKVVNNVQEGSSFYNRVGRKLSMKSLQIQGFLALSGTNAAATGVDFVRMIVFYDRQANGAAPTLADVLTSYDNAGATTSTALDYINMNNRDRFSILADERITLPPVGINGATAASAVVAGVDPLAGDTQIQFKRFIKLRGLETQYKATSNPGVIGDISTGSLMVLFVANATAVANAAFNAYWTSRLRYSDV